MIVGHLAVSALEHRYTGADFLPVMAAAVFPDAVDKVAYYVLDAADSGRSWGHTLLAAFITTAITYLLFGKRKGMSWALGYLSHLVCDIGGVVPWLYPFVAYEYPPAQSFWTNLWTGLTQPRMLLEIALIIWAGFALRPQWKAGAGHLRDGVQKKWRALQDRTVES